MQLSDTVVLKDGTLATKKVEELKDGDAGVTQTVAKMKRLVLRDSKNPDVIEIANDLKGKNDVETAYNIFNFVVSNYNYKSDPADSEFITAPIHIINETSPYDYNDCDDLSAVLACLLLASGEGFRVKFKVIAWRKQAYTHVYIVCFIPSQKVWIPMDAVMKKKGFGSERPKIIRRKYFDIA